MDLAMYCNEHYYIIVISKDYNNLSDLLFYRCSNK